VIARTGEPWLPEDVYAALGDGRAFLHVAMDGERIGFFVVATPQDGDLFVWAAAALTGGVRVRDVIAWIKRHAADCGFARVCFASPRKGWKRYFETMNDEQAA
jgi:hypothetical protein